MITFHYIFSVKDSLDIIINFIKIFCESKKCCILATGNTVCNKQLNSKLCHARVRLTMVQGVLLVRIHTLLLCLAVCLLKPI